jgi:hypothetical protein
MEKKGKSCLLYGLVLTAVGLASLSPTLAPFGVGLSLFVPALFVLCGRESLLFPLAVSVPPFFLVAFFNPQVSVDLLGLVASGILFKLFEEKPSWAVLSSSALLFALALLEEFLFGLPQEVKQLKAFYQFRFGFYALSALLLSTASYGLALFFQKKGELFYRLKFGFWTVLFFIVSAASSLLLRGEAKVAAENFLVAALGLFVAQGIALFFYFVQRFSPFVKLLIFLLALIFPMGFLLTALALGFLDNWFDFRKLNRGGEGDGSNSP